MDRRPLIISGFAGTAGRFGGIAAQILQDRLELLALELREAKIRFVQALLLVCMGVVFSLLGLLLSISGAVLAQFNLDASSMDLINADYIIGRRRASVSFSRSSLFIPKGDGFASPAGHSSQGDPGCR